MLNNLKLESNRRLGYFIIGVLLFISTVCGQPSFAVKETIYFPAVFDLKGFSPDKIEVGAGGHLYFLDQSSRQLAVLTPTGEIRISGGYGREQDSFFDPIGITTYNLRVWLSDRSENRLIEYDHRLNYIQSEVHDPFYPELIAADSWGNIVLYSEQSEAIIRRNITGWEPLPFIDLTTVEGISNCVKDMVISSYGYTTLLVPCRNHLIVFNRLGMMTNTFPISIPEPNFLVSVNNSWLVLNVGGQLQIFPSGVSDSIAIEKLILDATAYDNHLYLLTSQYVLIINVTIN